MIRTTLIAGLVSWILAVGLPSDASAQTIITGTVRSKAGKPLPGLALLEKGEIHNNVWDRGGLVDPQGRFRIEVASVGQYGLHVYSSGYIYAPQAVKAETGKTIELQIVLVPEPSGLALGVSIAIAAIACAAYRAKSFVPSGPCPDA